METIHKDVLNLLMTKYIRGISWLALTSVSKKFFKFRDDLSLDDWIEIRRQFIFQRIKKDQSRYT